MGYNGLHIYSVTIGHYIINEEYRDLYNQGLKPSDISMYLIHCIIQFILYYSIVRDVYTSSIYYTLDSE